jgi:hypothetical protein
VQAFFFGKTSHLPRLSAPLQSRFGHLRFLDFLKAKSALQGRRFQNEDEIKENATRQLMAIPQKGFADCFEKWKER